MMNFNNAGRKQKINVEQAVLFDLEISHWGDGGKKVRCLLSVNVS